MVYLEWLRFQLHRCKRTVASKARSQSPQSWQSAFVGSIMVHRAVHSRTFPLQWRSITSCELLRSLCSMGGRWLCSCSMPCTPCAQSDSRQVLAHLLSMPDGLSQGQIAAMVTICALLA